jgi:hypothetical protein
LDGIKEVEMTNFEKLLKNEKEQIIKLIAGNTCILEELIENEKEQIIKLIAVETCIDTKKHKIDKHLECEDCIFGKECILEAIEWLESEVER